MWVDAGAGTCLSVWVKCRVGQNRIYTPYMTVYLMKSLQEIPYVHRICMVLANPSKMPWFNHFRHGLRKNTIRVWAIQHPAEIKSKEKESQAQSQHKQKASRDWCIHCCTHVVVLLLKQNKKASYKATLEAPKRGVTQLQPAALHPVTFSSSASQIDAHTKQGGCAVVGELWHGKTWLRWS